MKLEIGPFHRDCSPAPVSLADTETLRGQAKPGPGDSLENYTAGQPFPMDEIDCTGDPDAGAKVMWNFHYRWAPLSGLSSFFYRDRGEELPLCYEGTGGGVQLSRRSEPTMLEDGGDLFRGENRKTATWVYVPTLRRVRRISTAQRTDAISGTDFTLDDLFSFNGIVPQYSWRCLGKQEVLAPTNTTVKGYPYEKEQSFGPYGLSFASDRWEMRRAIIVRIDPKNLEHPYHHENIYLDEQTLRPALFPGLRPEGAALEADPPQQALERGRGADRQVVRAVGGGAGAEAALGGERHHHQRPDRHRQPHRIPGRRRPARRQQGAHRPLHRRGTADARALRPRVGRPAAGNRD
jgi:hypothetical protein